jgi:hypothetical protein
MKRKVFFASLALGLALLGPARPSLAAETGSDTISRLIKEGWTLVSPNVLQRNMGNGKVETIGFGVEGLKFKIEGMKKDLAFFKESLRRNPDYQIRQTVQAYRAEIKRLTNNLALMAEADEVTDKAGIDCTISYGAHVDAFPLNGSQGVSASADSYFNNNCTQHGQQGEVWVTTTSEARNATGTFTRSIKTDPLAGVSAPYIGYNVRAASSTSVNGVTECLSHAYASMTSYDIGVVYEQRAENRLCPGNPPTVTITGPTSTFVSGYNCTTLTWNASVSGGTPGYAYTWYWDGYAVGSGSSYSEMFCGSNYTYQQYVYLSLAVSDSAGRSASDDHSATIYYSGNTNTCDPYDPYNYRLCPAQPSDL